MPMLPGGAQIAITGVAATTAAVFCAAWGTFIPSSRLWGNVISRGLSAPHSNAIALTFDDGPTPRHTLAMLDQLDALQVSAAFFVIGANCHMHPEIVREIAARGHLVANHSFDHAHLGLFHGWSYWHDQLRRTSDTIEEACGLRPAFFRPPMGFLTPPIFAAARAQNLAVINWSRRAIDGVRTETPRILARLRSSHPGDILMLHDGVEPNVRKSGYRERAPTIAAIGPLVKKLRERGLAISRLDALLGMPAYQSEMASAR